MEQHGNNHRQLVYAIIPARFSSTRLEGKLLLPLNGKPLILHTLEQAKKARNIDKVIVATDDQRILQIIMESGNEAILTSINHQSGSDRIAEVAENLPANSIIVNVQGDEPTISPTTIERAVEAILGRNATMSESGESVADTLPHGRVSDFEVDISTTCEKIEDYRDVLSPDVVKVVTDNNGFALCFSRSPIPFPREAVKKHGTLENALRREPNLISLFRKHTGIYVYRREYLLKFTRLEQTNLEKTEMLEQLRALENGARIKVVEIAESSIGVDTQEDFERVKMLFEGSEKKCQNNNFTYRRGTLSDLPSVAKVYVVSSQNAFQGLVPQDYLDKLSEGEEKVNFWKTYQKNSYQIYIAENEQSEVVGFVDFEELPKGIPFDFKLISLYVLPDFQRHGIGRELFVLAIKEMLSQGKNSMVLEALEISPFNSFYDKQGGEIIGFSHHTLADKIFKALVYGWKDLTKI